jgi:hypothetical protein
MMELLFQLLPRRLQYLSKRPLATEHGLQDIAVSAIVRLSDVARLCSRL